MVYKPSFVPQFLQYTAWSGFWVLQFSQNPLKFEGLGIVNVFVAPAYRLNLSPLSHRNRETRYFWKFHSRSGGVDIGVPHLGQFRTGNSPGLGFLENGYLRWAEAWSFCLHGLAKLPSHFVAAGIDPDQESLALDCSSVVRVQVFDKFRVN